MPLFAHALCPICCHSDPQWNDKLFNISSCLKVNPTFNWEPLNAYDSFGFTIFPFTKQIFSRFSYLLELGASHRRRQKPQTNTMRNPTFSHSTYHPHEAPLLLAHQNFSSYRMRDFIQTLHFPAETVIECFRKIFFVNERRPTRPSWLPNSMNRRLVQFCERKLGSFVFQEKPPSPPCGWCPRLAALAKATSID